MTVNNMFKVDRIFRSTNHQRNNPHYMSKENQDNSKSSDSFKDIFIEKLNKHKG